MLSSLELTLALLAAAVLAVVLLRAVGLPPLVAYLLVGVLLGPHAAGLTANDQSTQALGEIGVVFLMFSIGLEFNLDKLKTLRHHVFGLGSAQVALSIAFTVAMLVLAPSALVAWFFPGGTDWRGAVALGGALALSSTALVMKILAEKREIESEHGQRVFGVLLFQDLAVIPLLIVIPALASGGNDWLWALAVAMFKATCLLILLLKFGPNLMGHWFRLVARQKSHELFTLNVLFATLLFAWLTGKAGLSMELGAFVAGMLIAETEFKDQVEEDIKPFRDVLLGLFFVSIGARLNLDVVVSGWAQVLALLCVPVIGKFILVWALARAFKASNGVAIRTGIWLAQAGEFGFVLLTQAVGVKLLSEATVQYALAAMLISLLISPLFIMQANRLALRASSQEWLERSMQLQNIAAKSFGRSKHILIAGFGRSGQALAHVLSSEKVPYFALDMDADRVRLATEGGEAVVYADALKKDALLAAGIHRAKALVITFGDLPSSLKLLKLVRELAPHLPTIVRCETEADLERLREAGATQVIPEISEGSLVIASHALSMAGLPAAQILKRMHDIREDRYRVLQGYFHGADDAQDDQIEKDPLHLHTFALPSRSIAIGKAIKDIDWHGASVTTVVGKRGRTASPEPGFILQAGDSVVLLGRMEQVNAAETGLK
jgi:monovalent cation:H+ antiporter-2, CPA2 family